MIIKTTATLEGVNNVIELLRELPPNVAGKLVKPAMTEAGNSLRERTRWEAYRQLQQAEGRGYERKKPGRHLYTTAAARVKTYRQGNTTFVAVGFDYRAGGSHAHFVELGHRIVKGGTLEKEHKQYATARSAAVAALLSGQDRLPGITAAGKRWLGQHGLVQGDYKVDRLGRSRTGKKRTRIARGAWKYTGERSWLGMTPGQILEGGQGPGKIGRQMFGRTIRGGGRLTGGTTREFPMLRPAFESMKRPMLITIENELKKIEGEASRLCQHKAAVRQTFRGKVI